MRHSIFFRLSVVAGFIFILSSRAFGVTAAEYANAGLQLYNQKNYTQAIRYYSAALGLDPNNTAALQGRGNCYYIQGQYQQALADYQKVQSLAPSPQLSQFIQSLQSKLGTASASPAPAGQGPTGTAGSTGDAYFNYAVSLYQQKQYAASIPYFKAAVQLNPNDAKMNYYLGLAYLMSGDTKNAALNLALSDRKQPNPSVQAYVTQLKARLTQEEQQWLDGQLAASGTASAAQVSAPKKPKALGIRLEPGINLLNLADFTANAQTNQNAATTLRLSDPTYSFTAHVPTLCPNIGLEPVLRIMPNLEIGLPLSFLPVGTADDNISNSGSVTFTDSFQISALGIGLNARYLIGTGDFQPFIAAGGLLEAINIGYSYSYASSSIPPNGTATASGNFMGLAFGGQVKLGLDWHLGDTFAISPSVGYQLASANSFTSTLNSSGSQSGQSAQLSVIPTADGNVITPTAGGNLLVPVVSSGGNLWPNTPAPAGTRPLSVDLSGVTAGIQVSVFF